MVNSPCILTTQRLMISSSKTPLTLKLLCFHLYGVTPMATRWDSCTNSTRQTRADIVELALLPWPRIACPASVTLTCKMPILTIVLWCTTTEQTTLRSISRTQQRSLKIVPSSGDSTRPTNVLSWAQIRQSLGLAIDSYPKQTPVQLAHLVTTDSHHKVAKTQTRQMTSQFGSTKQVPHGQLQLLRLSRGRPRSSLALRPPSRHRSSHSECLWDLKH